MKRAPKKPVLKPFFKNKSHQQDDESNPSALIKSHARVRVKVLVHTFGDCCPSGQNMKRTEQNKKQWLSV